MRHVSRRGRPLPISAYRVEVLLDPGDGEARAPWLVSNPIWVDRTHVPAAKAASDPVTSTPIRISPVETFSDRLWSLEHDDESRGSLSEDSGALRFDFSLGARRGGWVAAALTLPQAARAALATAPAVGVRVRANRPLRFSLQWRQASRSTDLRWTRSLFADGIWRTATTPAREFQPVGAAAAAAALQQADVLLLVIDRTNAAAGSEGTLWFQEIALEAGGIVKP